MTDVEGFVMMFFRTNGRCRIHTVGQLDIRDVAEAAQRTLALMLKDIQGEKIDYAA